MSKAKGKGKSARQKLRRRAKRAAAPKQSAVGAAVSSGMKFDLPKVDWTAKGKAMQAVAHNVKLLAEYKAQFLKDEVVRMEAHVVSAVAHSMTEVHIPDALIKARATVVDLTTASHKWNHGEGEGDKCEYCGDKDYMADKYCSMSILTSKYLREGLVMDRDDLLPPVGTVESDLIFGDGELGDELVQEHEGDDIFTTTDPNCTDHICRNDCENCGCVEEMGITISGGTTKGDGVLE